MVMMRAGCHCRGIVWEVIIVMLVSGGAGAQHCDDHMDMVVVEAAVRESFKAEAEGRLGDALHAVQSDLKPLVARHPILRYRAGKVLMQQKMWAAAMVALHEACQGDPEQPGLFSHLAFALRMLGDVSAARRALRAARSLDALDQWLAPQLLQLHLKNSMALMPQERRSISRRAGAFCACIILCRLPQSSIVQVFVLRVVYFLSLGMHACMYAFLYLDMANALCIWTSACMHACVMVQDVSPPCCHSLSSRPTHTPTNTPTQPGASLQRGRLLW